MEFNELWADMWAARRRAALAAYSRQFDRMLKTPASLPNRLRHETEVKDLVFEVEIMPFLAGTSDVDPFCRVKRPFN